MKRRKFLTQTPALLGGGLIAAHTAQATAVTAPPSAPPASKVRVELLRVCLYNNEWDEGRWTWPVLPVGAPLIVVRDRSQRWDDNAVRFVWRGYRIGQLSRTENTTIAHLLDQGHRIEACVNDVQDRDKLWIGIGVTVWLCV